MARDDFKSGVRNSLRLRAAFICSNPGCRKQTIAPAASSDDKYVYTGKAAHITAASVGGARYDNSMSSEERSGINNAIFLCSTCADAVDKNGGADYSIELLREWKTDHECWVAANLNRGPQGVGGEGGSGTIVGSRGVIIGGRGGSGGIAGVGGKGGSGFIKGDDGLIIGGDGGSCPTGDGRGGRRASGPTERPGFPSSMWGFGRGGQGQNHPEYDRRIMLLTKFRSEYISKFPGDATFIEAGIEMVPVDWINTRLVEEKENWNVELGDEGYLLPQL